MTITHQVGRLVVAAGVATLAYSCGEVTVDPDARAGDGDAGGGSQADGGSGAGGDARTECDDGFTGAECDECTVFVNGDEGSDSNPGLSWDDAVAGVDEGIARASARLEDGDIDRCSLWVRGGTYVPGTEADDSFELQPGVHLYGGFAGFEDARSERNVETQETVLSGDLEGDDHAFHVVLGADEATLDGFTITGGRADDDRSGGGLANDDASPTVRNAIFADNQADDSGGAMHNAGDSSPTITNVAFSGNQAGGGGGAMSNSHESQPTITNTTFSDNQADFRGGAMSNAGSSAPTITNTMFTDNDADFRGGAMDNDAASTPTVTNVVFAGNSSGSGGAMSNSHESQPTITNTTFRGNVADGGGAMRNEIRTEVEIVNSILWENESPDGEDEIDHDVDSDGAIAISHSIIEDMEEADFGGDGDVDVDFEDDADPLFANAAGGDLRLTEDSPAIEAGNDTVTEEPDFPDVDLDGNLRVVGDAIDLGPYEFQP